ncbi:MAG: cob(I)yrinic acid a,c-diamide adenosyltransferase [Anaerolineae bacterium]
MSDSGFYTGRGDRGDTSRLKGAERISKSSALVEAVGTLDEATSAIGLARSLTQSNALTEALTLVQRHIYRLASHLSAVPEARKEYPGLSQGDVDWLEGVIAELEADLPALKGFVLPGESTSGAACHLARTVVRRAERRLVTLAELEPPIGDANLAYINRLSSLMFVAALSEDLMSSQRLNPAREQAES